jgi:hypothetical protein
LIMPQVSAQPGIFDYGLAMDKGTAMAAPYGGTGGGGSGRYGELADQTRQPGFAAQQNALGMYGAAANGQGESAAQRLLAMESGRNQRQAYQLAASGRGGNLASMQRAALGAQAGAQAQTRQQAATLRADEIASARAGYAGLAGQMYGQGLAYDQLGGQTGIAGAQNALDWYKAQRGFQMQEDQNRFTRGMAIANGVIGGVSAVGDMVGGAMGSDIRTKMNVKPTMGGNPSMGSFEDRLVGSNINANGPTYGQRDDAVLFGGNPYGVDQDISFGDRMQSRRGQISNTSPFEVQRGSSGMSARLGGDTGSAAGFDVTPVDDAQFQKEASAMASRTKMGEIASQMGMTPAGDGMAQIKGMGGNNGFTDDMNGFEKLGRAFSLSDENAKQGISSTSSPMSATQAIGSIEPVSYEYKPGYGQPGQRVGVIAQDLEKTPAGAAIVQQTPYGKALDVGGMSSLALAGQAEALKRERDLTARLDQLEGSIAAGGYGPAYRPRGPTYAQGSTISQQKVRNAA